MAWNSSGSETRPGSCFPPMFGHWQARGSDASWVKMCSKRPSSGSSPWLLLHRVAGHWEIGKRGLGSGVGELSELKQLQLSFDTSGLFHIVLSSLPVILVLSHAPVSHMTPSLPGLIIRRTNYLCPVWVSQCQNDPLGIGKLRFNVLLLVLCLEP